MCLGNSNPISSDAWTQLAPALDPFRSDNPLTGSGSWANFIDPGNITGINPPAVTPSENPVKYAGEETKRQQDLIDKINNIYAARAPDYAKMASSTYDAAKSALDQQARKTGLGLKFAMARGGQTGGSVQADKNAAFATDYARGVLGAKKAGDQAGMNLYNADQASKQRLIGLIQSGLSATDAAQAAAAMQSAELGAQGSMIPAYSASGFFGDLAPAIAQSYYQHQYDNAYRQQQLGSDPYGYLSARDPNLGSL